jgi:hypothetical protein
MLDDPQVVDMAMPLGEGATMLVVQDFVPWSDPDADDRLNQFRAKLDGYANYVASPRFLQDHPQGDRTRVVISVLTVAPPSPRMRSTVNVLTPGQPAYEILVRFADDAVNKQEPVSRKPWWKFW